METAEPLDWRREQRRRFVLNELGVVPLVSLRDAPGALRAQRYSAPASVVVVPPRAGAASGSKAATGVDKASRPIPGEARAEMDRLRASLGTVDSKSSGKGPALDAPKQPTTPTVAEPGTAKPGNEVSATTAAPRQPVGSSASTAVSFSLLMATCGRWLWIEALEDGLIRREQLQLIHAMARAVDGVEVQLTHRQFDWPIASHPHLPKDLESARQSVAGQSLRLAKDSGVSGVILLGEEAGGYLAQLPTLQRIEIPSTLAMLRDAAHKKAAWQVLKPLRISS